MTTATMPAVLPPLPLTLERAIRVKLTQAYARGLTDGRERERQAPPSPPVPARGVRALPVVTFSELSPAHDEIALAGKDGKRATALMAAAKATGREVLARLTERAVDRLLKEPNPLAASVLFSDDELREVADSLAATNATADLLGRARVRRMAERAQRQAGGVKAFAERDDDPFDVFDESPPALSPNRAADYFQKLVPSIGVDPQRFGPLFDRHAFTLAHAADQVLLEKVKGIIQEQLTAGTRPEAVADIAEALDAAGVTVKNPQYQEMVYRTNMNDSYMQGFSAEMADPVMRETFPAWQYVGIRDGRQGKDHEQRFDKYYPASATFAEVRGNRPWNCRCSAIPVTKYELDDLQKRGVKIEERW